MIRVMYRWRLKNDRAPAFVSSWEEATRHIQAKAAGARGSVLLESTRALGELVAIARWESLDAWKASRTELDDIVPAEITAEMKASTAAPTEIEIFEERYAPEEQPPPRLGGRLAMRPAIIAGSHRREGETGKVARYLATRCSALAEQAPWLLDLAVTPLPSWDESFGALEGEWFDRWTPIAEELDRSDAIIVVTPEWGGMVPSALKNFFLLCARGELAHKPACIVAVSAGTGGAYPIAELRMSSYKNTYLCYIPEQIIIRSVGQMLNAAEPSSEADLRLRERVDYALGVLAAYAAALTQVRTSGRIDLSRYPFGM